MKLCMPVTCYNINNKTQYNTSYTNMELWNTKKETFQRNTMSMTYFLHKMQEA